MDAIDRNALEVIVGGYLDGAWDRFKSGYSEEVAYAYQRHGPERLDLFSVGRGVWNPVVAGAVYGLGAPISGAQNAFGWPRNVRALMQ